jgi:streptogramin lyase
VWVDEHSGFSPSKLFVSSGKEIWGVGNYGYSQFPGFLSRYNTELDRFEPVIDREGLLVDSLGNFDVDDDGQGVLWLVLPDDTVARFDPKRREAEIVLDRSDGYKFSEIAVGLDGKIWLSAKAIREMKIDELWIPSELVQYDPALDKLSLFDVSPDLVGANLPIPLFIDRQGRVWAGGEWLEITSDGRYEWYALTPQPEFVRLNLHFPGLEFSVPKYIVAHPDPVLDASDGSMWLSGGGILRLDPESGEWCRVTDGRPIYEIIEDGESYLWISDGHQLYKKSLKP